MVADHQRENRREVNEMKKIIVMLGAALMIIGLVGCGSKDKKDQPSQKDSYVFQSKDVVIAMSDNAEPILKKLGEADKTFESKSCAFEGLDKEYSYPGFVLKTYPDGDKDFVASVTLFDDTVETKEGIAIGASKEDVIAAYGKCTESDTVCEYKKGNVKLLFILTDGVVSSIQYVALVD